MQMELKTLVEEEMSGRSGMKLRTKMEVLFLQDQPEEARKTGFYEFELTDEASVQHDLIWCSREETFQECMQVFEKGELLFVYDSRVPKAFKLDLMNQTVEALKEVSLNQFESEFINLFPGT